jgi:hypothetical protein
MEDQYVEWDDVDESKKDDVDQTKAEPIKSGYPNCDYFTFKQNLNKLKIFNTL